MKGSVTNGRTGNRKSNGTEQSPKKRLYHITQFSIQYHGCFKQGRQKGINYSIITVVNNWGRDWSPTSQLKMNSR